MARTFIARVLLTLLLNKIFGPDLPPGEAVVYFFSKQTLLGIVGSTGHTKRPDEKTTSRCLFNESQPHAKELFGHAIQRWWNFSDQFSDNSKPIMSTLA